MRPRGAPPIFDGEFSSTGAPRRYLVRMIRVPSTATLGRMLSRLAYTHHGSPRCVALPEMKAARDRLPTHPPHTCACRATALACFVVMPTGRTSRASLASISHQVRLCKVQAARVWDEWASGHPCVHRAIGSGHRGGRDARKDAP